MPFSVPPTSAKHCPIASLPLASPHLGKWTCASSAKRSRMLPPVDVTPPLSKAFRYSSATDLRCSSVIVCCATATTHLLVSVADTLTRVRVLSSSSARGRHGKDVAPPGVLVTKTRALSPAPRSGSARRDVHEAPDGSC